MRLYLRYSFELVTLLCSYLLFYLNIYHRSEQTIYNEIYSPLALELSSFKYSITDQVMDSYPMWGYPIVISIFQNNETLVLLFHFLLLLISSIIYFNYSHNFINSKIIKGLVGILFIFYSLTISVKWPDAVLVFLLFIFCFFHSKKYFLFATISLALAYNFRSEALIFLLIYSTYLIINKKKIHLLALLFLLPWNVLQYISNNKIVLTSSNSGSVLYITLGQLKDNIWNIEHSDNFAKEKVFVTINSDSETTEVIVEDDGDGFPKDILDKIGEPYIRSKKKNFSKKSGLGLGIFIGGTLLERNFAKVTCRNSITRNGAEVIIKWKNKDLLAI